jgi:hypothetical protein
VLIALLLFSRKCFGFDILRFNSHLAFECLLHVCFWDEGVLASIPLGSTVPWLSSAYCTLLLGWRCFGFDTLKFDSPLAFECLLHFCFWAKGVLASKPLGSTAHCPALLDKYAKFAGYGNFANLVNLSIHNTMVDVCNSLLLRPKTNCDLLQRSIKVESQ